jgi:hypothetical protein
MKKTLHVVLWVVEFVIGLALILALLLFLAPWLLRFSPVRSAIFGMFKAEIAIEQLEIGWWNPTNIEGLTYKSADRHVVLCCQKISTPSSLWAILFGVHELGNLTIESPTAALLFERVEPVAFQAAGTPEFKFDLAKVWKSLTPHLSGNIDLGDGLVIVQGKDMEDIRIENISLKATLPKRTDYVKFDFAGDTRQGQQIGTMKLSGNFGPLDSSEPILNAQGQIEKLPVYAVDQFVALFYPRWEGFIYAGIGPTLDLKADGKLSNRRLDLYFAASSAQFNGDLRLITQEGKISLSGPARFGLTLTAFLADEVFSLSPYLMGMQLSTSPRITFDLNQLTIPLSETGIAWETLSLDGELNLLNMQVSTPALFQGIALDRFKASVKSENLSKQVLFDATSKISFGDKTALIAASGEIDDTFEATSPLTIALSTKDFPVVILDQVMATSGFLQDAVGPTCSFNAAVDKTGDKRSAILYFSSPTIAMNNANFHLLDDGVILKSPVHMSFSPSSAFWNKHAAGMGITPADVLIEELDYRFGSIPSIRTKGVAKSEKLFYQQFALANPSLSFDIQTLFSMTFTGIAEGINAQAKLGYDTKKNTIALLQPFVLALNLSQEKTSQLWKELGFSPPFESALVFNATMQPFQTSLGQNFMRGTVIQGIADMPSLVAKSTTQTSAIIQNAKMQWNLDANAGKFFCKLDAIAGTDPSSMTPLHAEILVQNFLFQPKMNFENTASIVRINTQKLDTRFLDAWEGDAYFSSLFGSWISAKGEISLKPSYSSINLDASCEKGTFTAALAKENNVLSLLGPQPLKANFTLDPTGFSAIGKNLPVTLQKPCLIDLKINSLYLPLEAEKFEDLRINGVLQTDYLALVEKATNNLVSLSHLTFRMSKNGQKTSPLLVNLKTSIEGTKLGQVDVNSAISGICHTEAGWDFTKAGADITANFQQLPTSVLDTLATAAGVQQGVFPILFGDQISGSLTTNIQESTGPVSLTVNSPSTRISLDGQLQSGVLTLNQPFFAQVTMTEGISRLFLKGVNPLSISAIRSEGPMTLNVDKQGFSLPILPWNIGNAKIPHMRIEVGRLVCRNQGNIHTAIGLLKLGQFSNSKDLNLWFAPMDLSLANGIIECERTEILVADSIEIATWGQVNLLKNWVDAVLGLTAQALSKAFGITGLPENYVLQIPMKGPIDNVEIDTKKATAKVALLLAAQNASAAGSMIGGQAGGIVGGLIGQIAKLPDANSSAPPAKHPFPWEQQSPSPNRAPPKKRKNAIKPGDKPLKQLLKLLK